MRELRGDLLRDHLKPSASPPELAARLWALQVQTPRELAQLPGAAALSQLWARRAGSELRASVFFARFAERLVQEERPLALCWLAARGVSDELRHAEICRAMASLYAGRELPLPRPEGLAVPELEGVSPALETAVLITALCCVNESLSTSYLAECLAASEHETAREALRALLSDEVDHARLGWGYLESLDAPARQALGTRLPWIVRTATRTWIGSLRDWPNPPQPAHGLLPRAQIAAIVCEGMRGLVLPGFIRAGLDAGEAAHWFEHDGARWLQAG